MGETAVSELLSSAELDRCERMLTHCTCHPAFKDRGRTDPECAGCDLGAEVIDHFRAMRAHIADLQSQLAAQRERDGRDALLQAIHDEKQEWVGDFRRPVHKALDDLLAKFDAALKDRP